jgi:hypothetical protein
MRSFAIYLSIIAFILTAGFFASSQVSKEKTIALNSEAMLNQLSSPDIAYAPDLQRVLGAASVRQGSDRVEIKGGKKITVLHLLQQSHIVVVEYTENGAVVKSIDSVGVSEIERETNKKWTYTVNGKSTDLSPDRYTTSETDTIVWMYQ